VPISTPPPTPTRSPAIGGESAFTYCGSSFSECDGRRRPAAGAGCRPAYTGPSSRTAARAGDRR